MRKVVFVLLLILALLLASQSVLWERTIPFESDDDGPVGIDVAQNGDIYVVCYTNGPNYAVWDGSLISEPYTKLIELDAHGNILNSENKGVLFNNGIKGIGLTETGYTIFGNYSYGDPQFVPSSAWLIKFENDVRDTIKYDCAAFSDGYAFKQCKTCYYSEPAAVMREYYIGLKSSSGNDRLMNNDNVCIFNYESIDFPDSLFINPEMQWAQFFDLRDFDLTSDNELFITGSLSGMYVKNEMFDFIMKLDNERNVIWQKYFYSYDPPESQLKQSIRCVSATSDNGCLLGIWIDEDDDLDYDENENYIFRCDSLGNYSNSIGPFSDLVEFIYNVGNYEFIYKIENNPDITKIRLNGTEIETLWTHPFDNMSIYRTIENGFIAAGIGANNISIKKIATGTGIEDSSPLPSKTVLHQNYPNPFNPATEIRFSLERDAEIKLSVYNLAGENVSILANGKYGKGHHTVNFDGSKLNSGIYFYKLEADGKPVDTKRMLLIK